MRFKLRILIFLIFILAQKMSAQGIDSIACKKFEDTLLIIKNTVADVNSDPALKRLDAIRFLQRLTKISSTSGVSWIGPERPSQKDYDRWYCWYFENKKRLRWNPENGAIYLAEKTKDDIL